MGFEAKSRAIGSSATGRFRRNDRSHAEVAGEEESLSLGHFPFSIMNLHDQVVVITGGNQGFGKALCVAFHEEGARVVISSNDKANLERAAGELGVDAFAADVTQREDVEQLCRYAVEKYGQVDMWVNNAGIQIAPSPMEDVDEAKLRRLFDVNFFGYFYGAQVAMRQMKVQGHGAIVNVNSSAGLDGKPHLSAYVSSKFAVKGLTETLRKELADLGIAVYGVFPGGMQTDIYREQYPADFDQYMEVGPVARRVVENFMSDQPELDLIIKRPGR